MQKIHWVARQLHAQQWGEGEGADLRPSTTQK